MSSRLDCKKTLTTWQRPVDTCVVQYSISRKAFLQPPHTKKRPPRHAFSRLKGLDITETALPASCPSEAELPATRSNFSLSTTQNSLTLSAAFKRDHHLTRHRCLLRASRRIPITTPPVANIKHPFPLGKIIVFASPIHSRRGQFPTTSSHLDSVQLVTDICPSCPCTLSIGVSPRTRAVSTSSLNRFATSLITTSDSMKATSSRVSSQRALPEGPIGNVLAWRQAVPRSIEVTDIYLVQQQVQEAQIVREKVYQLEQTHMTLKAK